MREYEEGYPVDANDRYYQANYPDPDRRNSSNFGFANVKRNAAPGGNKAREDATDYLNERLKVMPYESTEVLFDQRVEFDTDGVYVQNSALPISNGDFVKVTLDGVEYELTEEVAALSPTVVCFGNAGFFGGTFSEIPFGVATGSVDGEEALSVVAPYYKGATVPIKIERTKVKTIDPKFLPEMSSYCHVNIWYDENDGEYKSDKTYDDIKAAEAAKTPVIGTLTVPSGNVYTLIGCDLALPSAYLVAFNLYNMPNTLKVFYAWIYSDNHVYVKASNFSGTVTDV